MIDEGLYSALTFGVGREVLEDEVVKREGVRRSLEGRDWAVREAVEAVRARSLASWGALEASISIGLLPVEVFLRPRHRIPVSRGKKAKSKVDKIRLTVVTAWTC